MLLNFGDRFALVCDGCEASIEIVTKDFSVAHRAGFDHGWQERVRKGGPTKSHWLCPTCAKSGAGGSKSMGPSTGAHGDIAKTK